MGRVVVFPNSPRKPALTLGDCPTCGANDGVLFDGHVHWGICLRHKVRWRADPRLFPPSTKTSANALWSNRTILGQMREVEVVPAAVGGAR